MLLMLSASSQHAVRMPPGMSRKPLLSTQRHRYLINRRKRAVKLGDFTALTLPTEGGVFPSKGSRRSEPWGARGPPRSLMTPSHTPWEKS
jgi:hypothetical protein